MSKEMTLEQMQNYYRLSSRIAAATESLNALCAEAQQIGLGTVMAVESYRTQALGDMFEREYSVLSVRVILNLSNATHCQ